MIRFDENPQPNNTGLMLQALLQGTAQFQRLRQQRKQDEEDQRNLRLRNLLSAGGGEVGDEDARFLAKAGLGSRLSPIAGAIAGGPRRFKINPTPQQQLDLVTTQKQMEALKQAEAQQKKMDAVRQFLISQQINDPEMMGQAYFRAGTEPPKYVMDLLNNAQAEAAQRRLFGQQGAMEGLRQQNRVALRQPTTPIKE